MFGNNNTSGGIGGMSNGFAFGNQGGFGNSTVSVNGQAVP
jgi:hypothetical protein